jgi:C4-dicarboxylate-specific signal transduction histidine kinase
VVKNLKALNEFPLEIAFPKKSLWASIFLTVLFIAEMFFSMNEYYRMLVQIQTEEIPLIETMAINLRLQESTNSKLQFVVYTGNQDELELFKQARFALWDQLTDYNGLLSGKNQDDLQGSLEFNRSTLNTLEDQILSMVAKKQIRAAQELFESEQFQRSASEFHGQFQNFSEKLNERRDLRIGRSLDKAYFVLGVSVIGLIIIFGMWVWVWRAYQQNLKRSQLLKNELELERARAFESSKFVTLGEMAGGIAHEINNPLSVILTNSHLIKMYMDNNGVDSAPYDKNLMRITKTVEQIAKIVRSLRTISGDITNESYNVINIKTLVGEVFELVQWKAKEQKIQLITHSEQFGIEFECQSIHIIQVLVNLIRNSIDAIKAIPAGKRWIDVSVEDKSDFVEIAVMDSGETIKKEIAEKIFNPFFTTKTVGQGTGLGLSISYQLVKDQGGLLYLDESSPHTRFVIQVPKKRLGEIPQNLKKVS